MAVDSVSGANNSEYLYSVSQNSAQKSNLDMQDFLMLVVAQMQNQDMNSSQDNGQFMAQMAQMASMQAMQELTAAYMSTMSVSYMGKYVKAEAVTNTGEMVSAEGYVNRVNFNGGDTMVLVDNIWFKVQDIYELALDETGGAAGTDSETENIENKITDDGYDIIDENTYA